jgi:hypothetical protein
MTGEPKRRAFLAAIAVSALVHGLLALAIVATAPEPWSPLPLHPVEIEFALEDSTREPDPDPAPSPDPDPAPDPDLAPVPDPTPVRVASLVEPHPDERDAVIDPIPEIDRDEDDDDRDRLRPRPSLDPSAVAAASITFDDSGPADEGVPEGRGPRDVGPDARSLERGLNDALTEAANARPHVSHRPPPELRARTDGSFVFRGHAFDAIIQADGDVVFSDRDNVAFNELDPGRPNGLVPSGTFDVTDAVMRGRGADPYRHERTWFMRETEALRERLEGRAREREGRRGASLVRRDLRRIWDGGGAARARRAQIFSLWDDCAEDELGRAARQAICSFVRENLPAGGPDAFTEAELASLNRQRVSRERFAPYQGTGTGTEP